MLLSVLMLLENNYYLLFWGEVLFGLWFFDMNFEGSFIKYCSYSSIVGGSLEYIFCDYDCRFRSGLIVFFIGR